ncbi:hypothetical protein [uncultured Pontibacter sp.]|uniref:hypothetical protein n=1 Tax=uncultured Pontibacter sp. TaxID=453356 RepID=UPI0026068170|nr:hypothetical protein [uncultured Pontibacter sp.]
MKNSNRTYAKVMLAAALGFSFAAEATNYNNIKSETAAFTVQDGQNMLPMQQELLGEFANMSAISAANTRQAYITFMENVRAKKDNWADQDWQNAKNVLERLNAHKETVEKELGTDDKGKIKLLQAEFRSLETKADIKD